MKLTDRIKWIDTAKGIAMILVIAGHTLYFSSAINTQCGSLIFKAIYSFHMPLFFMLSAYTMKFSANIYEWKFRTIKLARHLLGSAYFLYLLKTIISLAKDAISGSKIYIARLIYAVTGFLMNPSVKIFNYSTAEAGAVWFLIALFFAKVFYDLIKLLTKTNLQLTWSVLIIVLTGMVLGELVILPLSLDVSMVAIGFFYVSEQLKKYNESGGLLWFTIWIVVFVGCLRSETAYNMYRRSYPLYLLSFTYTISGSLFIMKLSEQICKVKWMNNILSFIGQNSLTLFGVHYLDSLWNKLYNFDNVWLTLIARLSVDTIIMIVTVSVKQLMNKQLSTKNIFMD